MTFRMERDPSAARWFAVWTRSRQEKMAAAMLTTLGVEHCLPLAAQTRQWSDRKQTVHVPLFSGYLFVRIDLTKSSQLQVLRAPGVAGLVGNSSGPLPIPDQQIENIRTVLVRRIQCTVAPYIQQGDRVRVVRGALAGIEGTLVRSGSCSRLLLSIDLIQKAMAVNVSRDDVEPVAQPASLSCRSISNPTTALGPVLFDGRRGFAEG